MTITEFVQQIKDQTAAKVGRWDVIPHMDGYRVHFEYDQGGPTLNVEWAVTSEFLEDSIPESLIASGVAKVRKILTNPTVNIPSFEIATDPEVTDL